MPTSKGCSLTIGNLRITPNELLTSQHSLCGVVPKVRPVRHIGPRNDHATLTEHLYLGQVGRL